MNDSRSATAARLTAIDQIVAKYIKRHVGLDVGIGIAGLVPLPGAGKAALITALALQAPIVYQPMVKKISAVYALTPDENMARVIGTANPIDAGLQVATEFGYAYMREHARELAHDQMFAFAASWIPVVGGVAAAGADAVIARKMTIIVAAMAVLYHENRSQWLESKEKTRTIVITALKTRVFVSFTSFVSTLIEQYLVSAQASSAQNRNDVGAEIDSAVTGFQEGHTVESLDPHVLDALERLQSARFHDLEGFKDAFTTNAGVFMDPGHMSNIKGYVGEEVAAEHLHESLPGDPRIEGWDIPYDGKLWQIKTGTSAYERSLEHLQKHPDQPIISDDDTVARLQGDGHTDAMPIHDLGNEHLVDMTHNTAVSIDQLIQMHPDLPIISTLLITVREIALLRSGQIGIARAIRNIAAQVGSREAAIFLFTFGAVGLAAAVHILPVAGPFVAGAAVTGGLTGKEIGARLREMRLPIPVAERLIAALRSMDRSQVAATVAEGT